MVKIARNKKTNKLYRILKEDIINATNGKEDEIMILYMSVNPLSRVNTDNQHYVREKIEFYEKFDILHNDVPLHF